MTSPRSHPSVGESARLGSAFSEAGIALLFAKGLPLGKLAYGDPFAKQAIDIDLLVADAQVVKAAALLGELGYAPVPPIRAERIGDWHRRSKESAWVHESGSQVDLHSRLTDSRRALAGFDLVKSSCLVTVSPGVEVRTFGGTALLAYLAVHGAASSWFRLKWLADFAALVSTLPDGEVERSWQECSRTGAAPAAALAFALAGEIFGTRLPRPVAQDGARLRRSLALSRANLFSVREPTERSFGTVGIHLLQLLLAPGLRARWSEGARQVQHALLTRGIA